MEVKFFINGKEVEELPFVIDKIEITGRTLNHKHWFGTKGIKCRV